MNWQTFWTILAQLVIFLIIIPFPFAFFWVLCSGVVSMMRPDPKSDTQVVYYGAYKNDLN